MSAPLSNYEITNAFLHNLLQGYKEEVMRISQLMLSEQLYENLEQKMIFFNLLKLLIIDPMMILIMYKLIRK